MTVKESATNKTVLHTLVYFSGSTVLLPTYIVLALAILLSDR